MKSKKFWKRLFAVLTLTLFLVTSPVPVGSNEAWAGNNCTSDKMGHTNCISRDTTTSNDTTIIINNNIVNNSSGQAEAFTAGVVVGAIGGSATTIAAVSGAGTVAGLSAAGVTSGLAAIGGVVGGGMVAGLAVTAAVPVSAAAIVGYGSYKAWKWLNSEKTPEKAN